MTWSEFGERFTRYTGARELMEDLGAAMSSSRDIKMLGGGNPAHIPEMEALFADELKRILLDEQEYRRMFANYAAPAGEQRFRAALAEYLSQEYGWSLTEKNVALTSGSQAGFFTLFNLFAGRQADGGFKKILLPLTPEYIGYQDVGLSPGMLTALKPTIEELDNNMFKYRLNVNDLHVGEDVAAICVSRPTNPTGNVLTDDEMQKLVDVASSADVPLIVDNAYGLPFPGIVFSDARPIWHENVVMCMSMSKLGLPGIRTGIVVASEQIVEALSSVNSVLSLAVSSVGAVLLNKLVVDGRLAQLGRELIQPFYRAKMELALNCLHKELQGLNYRVHVPEGALFLWLWFPDLPITSAELYARLRERDVIVLSGHHFFPGLQDDWPHRDQCIRLTYSQDDGSVQAGIQVLAAEVRRVCA